MSGQCRVLLVVFKPLYQRIDPVQERRDELLNGLLVLINFRQKSICLGEVDFLLAPRFAQGLFQYSSCEPRVNLHQRRRRL